MAAPHELQYFENGQVSETLLHYAEKTRGGVGLLEVSQLSIEPPNGVFFPEWKFDSSKPGIRSAKCVRSVIAELPVEE